MIFPTQIPLGVGYYTSPEAARLLGVDASRVRRWVAGYTFWLQSQKSGKRRRKQSPLLTTDLPVLDDVRALSFVELMELRVVKAFLVRGVPLQRVRVAAALAREHFGVAHPFASQKVYTDGQNIFAGLQKDAGIDAVVELTRKKYLQLQSGQLIHSCLDEIEFDQFSTIAHRWWPLSRDFPIVLDPLISFGAPIIAHTGVRTAVVAGMASAESVNAAADSFGLTSDAVSAALKFERILKAA
ncbi:MAG: hypothetical protein WEE89_18095 [Gemmatimonadota bacterium]